MPGPYSIGELAAATGLPSSTLRHYEREGLLAPDGRTESNYRVYGERSRERLLFIRAAQASGLALEDVRRLLALRDGCAKPCPEVRQVLDQRLANVEERLEDLRRVRTALRDALATCQSSSATGRCEVIAGLAQAPRRARTTR